MRSVTANLFGVARSSANNAREGNSITPATEINMLSVSQQILRLRLRKEGTDESQDYNRMVFN